MASKFRERLQLLAATIEQREQPLGVGLKNHCWAGVAYDVASANGARLTDYFGISTREMKAAIKTNNQSDPAARNAVMVRETRVLADMR